MVRLGQCRADASVEPELRFANFKTVDSDEMYELLKDPSIGMILRVGSEVEKSTDFLIDYSLATNNVRQQITRDGRKGEDADLKMEHAEDRFAWDNN